MISSFKKTGFSMVEMLLVISIISLLSSILIVNASASRAKARDAQRKYDIAQFQKALELCRDKKGNYALAETAVITPCAREPFHDQDFINSWQALCGEFLSELPTDPKGTSKNYLMHTTSDYNHYVLVAKLERLDDPAVMNAVQVSQYVDNVGISQWEACSDYNYIVGH